jgi:hypothetical protein
MFDQLAHWYAFRSACDQITGHALRLLRCVRALRATHRVHLRLRASTQKAAIAELMSEQVPAFFSLAFQWNECTQALITQIKS